jgi:hypothetical protein
MKSTAVYIYLAVGCGMLGIVITFIVLFICLYLGVDVAKNLWIITIPILLSIVLNILMIEFFTRRRK